MMQEFEVMVDKLAVYRFCTYVISLILQTLYAKRATFFKYILQIWK